MVEQDDDWMVRVLQEDITAMDNWPEWRKQEARTRFRGDAAKEYEEQQASKGATTSNALQPTAKTLHP